MDRKKKKNFLFLGFAIPNEEMEKTFILDNFPQIQTHKFNWNIIKGLEEVDEFEYTYISSRPVTDYPSFPEKKIRKRDWIVNLGNKNIEIIEIPFLNTGLLKLMTRFLTSLYYCLKSYNSKSNKGGVIVYSVHVPYMLVGFIVSKIYKIDFIAIWTDPPAVSTNHEFGLKSKLRNIELKISKILMGKVTKAIVLTKHLAKDFAPDKPYIVMEGIIDLSDVNQYPKKNQVMTKKTIKVVYTGSLEKKYGIKNIVEAVIAIKNPNLIFEIYGRGDYEDELIKISETNNKIQYKGFVSNKEVLNSQRTADFLINARSSVDEYSKYSFPSKTLEYMLSGTPLITTMLPGIPKEYEENVIVLENNKPETIANKLVEVLSGNENNRLELGQRALEFAKQKNYLSQAIRIIDFLNDDYKDI